MSSVASQATGKLSDFQSAVTEFQAAALGKYSGPSTPFHLLQDKILAVDGLNSSELVTNVAAAVGPTTKQARGLRGGLVGIAISFGIELASSLGAGTIIEVVKNKIFDNEEDDDQCSALIDDSKKCADTIDDICTTSDSAASEILGSAAELVSVLTSILRRSPNGELSQGTVAAADSIIESTYDQVIGTCQDRDEFLEKCYEEFTRRCDEVCERPIPEAPPETGSCPAPKPPAGEYTCEPPPQELEPCPEESSTSVPPPTKPVEAPCPEPVETKPVESTPAESKPVEPKPTETNKPSPPDSPKPQPVESNPKPQATEKKSCEKPSPVVDCEKPVPVADCEKPVPVADCEEEPAQPCEPTEVPETVEESISCTGILGLVGAGVAILGIGALMFFAAEQLELFGEVPTPEPEPTPQPEPAPEPMPEPEQPKDGVKPPPEDLSKVPEPTPPPKKLEAVSGNADIAVESPGESAPASSVDSSADRAADSSESSSPARKAGAW